MSIGPLSGNVGNIVSSIAGMPLAQARGADVDRAQHENSVQELRDQSDIKAEMAAGIGETDGTDHQTADRDADGRRLWERRREGPKMSADEETQPHVKDPTGQSGNALDLSG